jgi:hypothetical protein
VKITPHQGQPELAYRGGAALLAAAEVVAAEDSTSERAAGRYEWVGEREGRGGEATTDRA